MLRCLLGQFEPCWTLGWVQVWVSWWSKQDLRVQCRDHNYSNLYPSRNQDTSSCLGCWSIPWWSTESLEARLKKARGSTVGISDSNKYPPIPERNQTVHFLLLRQTTIFEVTVYLFHQEQPSRQSKFWRWFRRQSESECPQLLLGNLGSVSGWPAPLLDFSLLVRSTPRTISFGSQGACFAGSPFFIYL